MIYQATLIVPVVLFDCFLPEVRKEDRVEFKVTKTKVNCKIEIDAKDLLSFRATLTTLTKLLSVYDKIKEIA